MPKCSPTSTRAAMGRPPASRPSSAPAAMSVASARGSAVTTASFGWTGTLPTTSSTRCGYGATYPEHVMFAKGHGTQNDFVLLPDPDGRLSLTPAAVTALCDRRRGLGADGVLRVTRAGAAGLERIPEGVEPGDWYMDYRNADVTVEMGKTNQLGTGDAVVGGRPFAGLAIDVGNPHLACVDADLTVEDLAALDVPTRVAFDR